MASTSALCAMPYIHVLCKEERFSKALRAALVVYQLPPAISIAIHDCELSQLSSSVQFDTIVSPANSYGRLDGGFDDIISRAFSPKDEYLGLTLVAQAKLYEDWRGFAPPGTCTLVKIPEHFHERAMNIWGTRYLALCPTMRTPQEVQWDREVVYESIWSLLCAVDKHNRSATNSMGRSDSDIKSLLMVPMATGIGEVSAEKWAGQVVLALKHFVDALEHPAKWSALKPAEIFDYSNDVVDTWIL